MNNFLIILLLCSSVFLGCDSGNSNVDEAVSTDLVSNPITASGDDNSDLEVIITFDESSYNFGQIIQGERIKHSYTFTNTGEAALVISSVGASCGCTIPTWSEEPIEPGETGQIDVVFDSEGRSGAQSKDITVVSNAVPNTAVIRLTGEVIVP